MAREIEEFLYNEHLLDVEGLIEKHRQDDLGWRVEIVSQ